MNGIRIVTPPSADPVSLQEFKDHQRIDVSDEDGLIAGYILAARQYLESVTNRLFYTQTIEYVLPIFSTVLEFPVGPIQSIVTLKYFDQANAQQTLSTSAYTYTLVNEPLKIMAADGYSFPSTAITPEAVTIRAVAGYVQVPEQIRQAILLLAGHFYKNREAVGQADVELPFSVSALIAPYRVYYR